jgi:hypothetical protein
LPGRIEIGTDHYLNEPKIEPGGLDPPHRIKKWRETSRLALPYLKMRVTEFTVDTDDEDLQADYTSDFYTILFSHPEVVGVQFWAKTIDDNKGLYAYDWREKPSALDYKDLSQEITLTQMRSQEFHYRKTLENLFVRFRFATFNDLFISINSAASTRRIIKPNLILNPLSILLAHILGPNVHRNIPGSRKLAETISSRILTR